MKDLFRYLPILMACFLWACQDEETVFSYSPTTPRAGEKVYFSNLTDEGEEWAWEFGDGGTSTIKSPTKVYREPGTYTVTLTVDGKNYRRCTKTVTVLDTVPTLRCSADTIPYFTEVTFSVECYNPNDEKISCKWSLPTIAQITSTDTTSTTISVYFTRLSAQVPVRVDVTMGEKEFELWGNFEMKDRPAAGIMGCDSSGLYRQRIYSDGPDQTDYLLNGYKFHVKQMFVHKDFVYYLDGPTLESYELVDNHTLSTLVWTNDASCIWLMYPYMYYAEGGTIKEYNILAQQSTLFASSATLSDFPTTINSMVTYTSIFYVAQAKGVYRFTEQKESLGVILADYAITHLAVDEMARKLYFIADGALYVSHIDGTLPVQIAAAAKALCVDNVSGRLYFATPAGVAYLPLVQSQNNTTTAEPVLINDATSVVALTVDNTAR